MSIVTDEIEEANGNNLVALKNGKRSDHLRKQPQQQQKKKKKSHRTDPKRTLLFGTSNGGANVTLKSINVTRLINKDSREKLAVRLPKKLTSPTFDVRQLLDADATVRVPTLLFLRELHGQIAYLIDSKATEYDDLFQVVVKMLQQETDDNRPKAYELAVLSAAICKADTIPFAVSTLAKAIKGLRVPGLPPSKIEKEINEVLKRLRAGGRESNGVHQCVKDLLPDAPTQKKLVVPPGWMLNETSTFRLVEEQKQPPISAPLLIISREVEVESGVVWLTVTWKSGGKWDTRTVARGDVSDSRSIVKALAPYGCPVNSNNASQVVQYIADFEIANIGQLGPALITNHMGWCEVDSLPCFIWGNEVIASAQCSLRFQGRDDGDVQISKAFYHKGTSKAWMDLVRLIAHLPKVRIAIVASLAAPLLHILDSPNFIMDFAGNTSTGKTTTLRLAASVWGCPDERERFSVLKTWDATQVYRERAPAVLGNLPYFLDDTKRAADRDTVPKTVYMFVQGMGRGRGTVNGLAGQETWRSVMLSTGEDRLTTFSQDGGTRPRTLGFWGVPFENSERNTAELVTRVNLLATNNFGHAGPDFVRYLIDNHHHWPAWRKQFEQIRTNYNQRGVVGLAGRIVPYLATLELACLLAIKAGVLPASFENLVEPIWNEVIEGANEGDRATAAMKFVMDWVKSNRAKFLPTVADTREPHDGWAGRIIAEHNQDMEIQFYPHKLRAVLEEQDFSYDAVISTWGDRGWLHTDNEKNRRRNTFKVREGKTTHRVIAIVSGKANESLEEASPSDRVEYYEREHGEQEGNN